MMVGVRVRIRVGVGVRVSDRDRCAGGLPSPALAAFVGMYNDWHAALCLYRGHCLLQGASDVLHHVVTTFENE
jgi:hypothetical protein